MNGYIILFWIVFFDIVYSDLYFLGKHMVQITVLN